MSADAYKRRVAERDLLRDALREFHAFVLINMENDLNDDGQPYQVEDYLAWPNDRAVELWRLLR